MRFTEASWGRILLRMNASAADLIARHPTREEIGARFQPDGSACGVAIP